MSAALPDTAVADWCAAALGSRPVEVFLQAGYLSRVSGVRLADGRHLVVKDRPWRRRLAGCIAVQAQLAEAGFPCPRPLAGPDRVGERAFSAETLMADGRQLPVTSGADPFARLLAALVAAAPPPGSIPSLRPSPPWTAWDRPGSAVWPYRDELGRRGAPPGVPGWLDAAAARVRARLTAYASEPGVRLRVGHGDFESQNIRWNRTGRPIAVHDWDSLVAQPEAAIAGMAAAVWSAAGGPGQAAVIGQTVEFLDAYQDARQLRWSGDDLEAAWAAGLWVQLYDARLGPAHRERLAGELPERLARAGIGVPAGIDPGAAAWSC